MLTEPSSTSRDRTWIALLVLSYTYGLAISWQRWGNPLIDSGREMNVPLRLLSGETLYSDIRHIYGPVSPWIHALLYRVFGPTLTVLYADGIACAAAAIALVYWLSRQVMSPAASGAAALSVTWLCVFKQSGNYILPYSYNALHATVLGLATLAVLTRAVRSAAASDARPLTSGFLAAGLLAGLTLLAKTEMGVAAVAAGAVAAPLAASARRVSPLKPTASFLVPAIGIAAATYGLIAAQVGWSTLVNDSWLLAYNMPPELATYNRRLAGLDRPFYSIWRVLLAGVKLGIIAATIGALSALLARSTFATPASPRRRAIHGRASFLFEHPARTLAGIFAIAVILSLTTGLDWDKGPYLFMPVLLALVIIGSVRGIRDHATSGTTVASSLLLVYSVYALASIGRLALHVQSGGGYGAFLLPMSIVLFTYLWIGPFAGLLPEPRVAQVARTLALGLILASAVASAVMIGARYRTRNTVAIASSRGTMVAEKAVGEAWNQALTYVQTHTRPDDPIAVLPEGTSLTFLSGRRNPLREEIATPGFLTGAAESRAIRQLKDARTPLILIANRPTAEFGQNAFGRDYCVQLMTWIEAHYDPCAMFGATDPTLRVGARPFFIRAYCRVHPSG